MPQEIASLYAKIGASTTDFDRAMGGVENRLGKVGGAFGALGGVLKTTFMVGVGVAAAGVAGLTATIIDATGQAADMEQQLANISAVMGLTGEETNKLGELINDLGLDPKLKVTAVEAGQAIEMLAKNGLTLDQVLGGAARSTVFLANATGGTFADSADIATSAMIQFGIKAEDMSAAVNQMVGVTNASKFGIEDYGLALSMAGGVASSVGVSFDDFNATIAGISPLFNSGSDAGTSFKTFLQRLIPQSSDATTWMKKLGLMTEEGANQFFDASGKMKSMAQITKILNKALSGLSDAQKNEATSTIFGTDAQRAALALAAMTEDQFVSLKQTIGNTDAEKAAATRMDTLSGKWEIFRGVLDATAIQIGEKFLPQLKNILTWATDLAGKYGPSIVDWFGQIAWQFGQVTNALMGAFDAGGIGAVLQQLAAWGGDIFNAVRSWTVDLWNNTLAPGLQAMWSSFTGWLGDAARSADIGGKLVAWGSGFLDWAGQLWSGTLQPKLLEFWSSFASWLTDPNRPSEALSAITGAWTWFADWAGKLYSIVAPKLVSFWTGLTSWVTDPAKREALLNALINRWNAFTVWASGIWAVVQPKLVEFGANVKSWIDTNVPVLGGWIDAFGGMVTTIKEGWALHWPEITKIVTDGATQIGTDTGRILESLGEIGAWFTGGDGSKTKTDWANFWLGLLNVVTSMVTGTVKNIADLLQSFALLGASVQAVQSGDWGGVAANSAKAGELLKNLYSFANPLGMGIDYLTNANAGKDVGALMSGRAGGGPVSAGHSYMVGEQGPELFTPGTSGYITPNGAGGRMDIYVHGESSLPNDRMKLRELARALQQEISFTGAVMVN